MKIVGCDLHTRYQPGAPLLGLFEKWRTPSWLVPTVKGNPRLDSPL